LLGPGRTPAGVADDAVAYTGAQLQGDGQAATFGLGLSRRDASARLRDPLPLAQRRRPAQRLAKLRAKFNPMVTHAARTGAPPSTSRLQCGDFIVNPVERQLHSAAGELLPIGSRTFDVLLALIDGAGAPTSAAELSRKVWPGKPVADNNLRVQMTMLRRVIGREAVRYRPGHGYELLLPVQRVAANQEAATPGNLPEILWPMLGREAEQAMVLDALASSLRVSLVAAGGVGKTSLALTCASQLRGRYGHGVWWIDLTAWRDREQLPQQVAATLGLSVAQDQALQALGTALADWNALLVLDNCEHLAEPVATMADSLLRASPGVRILATSRVALRCAGERVLPLPELSLPPPAAPHWPAICQSGAATVFEARVRAADPRFRLKPENADLVAEICRRLDGNALALTLAAAQVPAFGLAQVVSQLDQRLAWAHPPWQGEEALHRRSLAATLEWSLQLLPASARRLLQRLGALGGVILLDIVAPIACAGCPEAAHSLQADLEALVAHSLLSLSAEGLSGTASEGGHYSMHASVRLFARQGLESSGEALTVYAAMAGWLLGRWPHLDARKPEDAPRILREIRLLQGDVEATLQQLMTSDLNTCIEIARRINHDLRRMGSHATFHRLGRPLPQEAQRQGDVQAQVLLLGAFCGVDFELDRLDDVLAHAGAMLELLGPDGDPVQRGLALSWHGTVMAHAQREAEAERWYREALQVLRTSDDLPAIRRAINNMGWVLQLLRRYDEARTLLLEALSLSTQARNDWDVMVSHENLGELELATGHFDAAARHLQQEVEPARRVPDLYRLAQALPLLAFARLKLDEPQRCRADLLESLDVSLKQGFRGLQCEVGCVLALLQARQGAFEAAQATLAFIAAVRQRESLRATSWSAAPEGEACALCEAALGEHARHLARLKGELMRAEDLRGALATDGVAA
jgi:predicted ATPase/DNA-binding winged helix-turn-helix (wHTH) protein